MKHIVLPGILSGIGMLFIGFGLSFLLGFIFPVIAKEYHNPNLFRPWSDPLMSLYFVHPFVVGIILAFIWGKVKKLFTGTTVSKGLLFGFSFWIAATFPGMFISYSSFPVSIMMIITWTLSGLAQELVAGVILAKMNP